MKHDSSDPLRTGLSGLSMVGIAGTLVELASLRHWTSTAEYIPWVALTLAGLALGAALLRPSAASVRMAMAAGVILAVAGVAGIVVHVISNLNAAPLDGTVGPTWDTLSTWKHVWLASTGGVGPAPPLAAASLIPTGLATMLAMYRHPASSRPDR